MNSDGLTSSKMEIIEVTENENPSGDDTAKRTLSSKLRTYLQECIQKHPSEIRTLRNAVIHFAFGCYFAWATYHLIELKKQNDSGGNFTRNTNTTTHEAGTRCQGYCGIQWCDGYGLLLILTIIVYSGLLISEISKREWCTHLSKQFTDVTKKIQLQDHKKIIWIIAMIIAIVFLYIDTYDSRDRLRSLSGIIILYGLGYLFSKDMTKILWRPVIVGFLLQFFLGMFCIRMEIGRRVFSCIGEKLTTFLNYARDGSKFVYGDLLVNVEHVLVFSVLTVIYLTSFCISILYYWGVMQWLVQKLGAPLRLALGTTVCESMATASNIFFGMSDTMLTIRPFVKFLTASEIHAIMTSCFATVAGDVLAAYIKFGAEAAHLITSSIMAAPAALCFSKLFYPETEKSQTTVDNCAMEKSSDTSVLEAASNGAFTATNLILGIVANLIAFVSFIAFANGITHWLGYLIGYDYLSFELFFAKLFIPLSYIIGIPWEDCEKIGQVIAMKTIVNEFVAYERLGELKRSGEVSLRSSAIATYAVCGFANPGSLGIIIGMITAICPDKQKVAASVGLRAFIAGSFVNFINASIAGLLMPAYLYEGMAANMTNTSP